jgi:hypothetical protein
MQMHISTSDKESYIFKEANNKYRRYPCSKVSSTFQAIFFQLQMPTWIKLIIWESRPFMLVCMQ